MRFEGLDLNLLAALDVLLETQSVTETARRLNLSQPTVSAALRRLRHYFRDELLTQIGRKLMPTARGQELAPAIKELLGLVRFRIAHVDVYEASKSQRRFNIIASDYAFDVLLSKVLARAERRAPGVTFDVSPTGPAGLRHFQNGDIDLMITVADYVLADHPQRQLFSDEYSVICWKRGKYAGGVSARQFLEADHAIVVLGEERRPTVAELHFQLTGVRRRIALQVPSFSALPAAVTGTNRLAVMHRRHAHLCSSFYPINSHALPVAGRGISEVAQWHRLRDNDSGVRWLIGLLTEEAASLRPQPLRTGRGAGARSGRLGKISPGR